MPTEKAPIIEEQPSAKAIIGSQPPQQPNTNGHAAAIRAKALWDYQAEVGFTCNLWKCSKAHLCQQDATELTFNPDDIISDIQMVHDGWWYGRAPNGSMGLFPSNYVQLLMWGWEEEEAKVKSIVPIFAMWMENEKIANKYFAIQIQLPFNKLYSVF